MALQHRYQWCDTLGEHRSDENAKQRERCDKREQYRVASQGLDEQTNHTEPPCMKRKRLRAVGQWRVTSRDPVHAMATPWRMVAATRAGWARRMPRRLPLNQ